MANIRITAQYFENKNPNPTPEFPNPSFRPKGATIFTIDADDDTVFYADNLEETLKTLIASYNNEMSRFELVDYEVNFSKPIVIDSDTFEKALMKQNVVDKM